MQNKLTLSDDKAFLASDFKQWRNIVFFKPFLAYRNRFDVTIDFARQAPHLTDARSRVLVEQGRVRRAEQQTEEARAEVARLKELLAQRGGTP